MMKFGTGEKPTLLYLINMLLQWGFVRLVRVEEKKAVGYDYKTSRENNGAIGEW